MSHRKPRPVRRPRPRPQPWPLFIALAALVLAGCGTTLNPPGTKEPEDNFRNGYRLFVHQSHGATCFVVTSAHRDEGPSIHCLPDSVLAKDGGR